ncbi:hypothetical protein [Pelagibacterium sp.]|uniref:hypothetical protein n=1 Tax=Pelagibacterium sp. TaxID=1967288 RepID=UPI003A925E71
MSSAILPRLTPRDFAILETILADHLGGGDQLIAAVRKKLRLAQLVFADDLAKDVATIGSRIVFSIDDGVPQERTLVSVEHYVPGQGHQTLASLRGVALLGLSAGERIAIDCGGRLEQLELHRVLYQPESEIKARKKQSPIHLVSSRDDKQSVGPHRLKMPHPDDDPGPSAA